MHIYVKIHQRCFKIWGPSKPAVLQVDFNSISKATLK